MKTRPWTSGPWVAQAGTTTGMEVVAPGQAKIRRTVARCGGRPVDREGNAHLISAAPDLYEALDDMLKRAPGSITQQAIDALAKARGDT